MPDRISSVKCIPLCVFGFPSIKFVYSHPPSATSHIPCCAAQFICTDSIFNFLTFWSLLNFISLLLYWISCIGGGGGSLPRSILTKPVCLADFHVRQNRSDFPISNRFYSIRTLINMRLDGLLMEFQSLPVL